MRRRTFLKGPLAVRGEEASAAQTEVDTWLRAIGTAPSMKWAKP